MQPKLIVGRLLLAIALWYYFFDLRSKMDELNEIEKCIHLSKNEPLLTTTKQKRKRCEIVLFRDNDFCILNPCINKHWSEYDHRYAAS